MDKLPIVLFGFALLTGVLAEVVIWSPPYNPFAILAIVTLGTFAEIVALIYLLAMRNRSASRKERRSVAYSVLIAFNILLTIIGILGILLLGLGVGSFGVVYFLGVAAGPYLLILDAVLLLYVMFDSMGR